MWIMINELLFSLFIFYIEGKLHKPQLGLTALQEFCHFPLQCFRVAVVTKQKACWKDIFPKLPFKLMAGIFNTFKYYVSCTDGKISVTII